MDALLALDCGNRWTGLALVVDGEPKGELHLDLGRRQGALLPEATNRLLALCDLSKESIGYVALAKGPGYFTSLRIGLAYGNALAFALGAKVITVSSLRALADGLGRPGETVCPLIAASRTQAFCAVYRDEEQLVAEGERQPEELASLLESEGLTPVFTAARDERLTGPWPGPLLIAPRNPAIPLALRAWRERHRAVTAFETEACYLREPGLGTAAPNLRR